MHDVSPKAENAEFALWALKLQDLSIFVLLAVKTQI